jgi:AraC-like DNA-binding protein
MNLEFYFIADLKKDKHVKMHSHRALELVYYLSGQGRSTIHKNPFDIRPNRFTIMPPGTFHDQINQTDVTSFCLGLSGSGLEKYQGCWFDAGGLIRTALDRFGDEMNAQRPFYLETARGILQEIIGLAKRAATENRQKPLANEVVSKALTLIRQHKGIVSVADLADKLYVSKDYLRHLFQEHTSQSPIRHIINTRIIKAKDLLADPDLPILEVAARCGFENFYYFSRLFKKETRQSPSEYRRSITEKGK